MYHQTTHASIHTHFETGRILYTRDGFLYHSLSVMQCHEKTARGSSRRSVVPLRRGTKWSNEVRGCCIDCRVAYPDPSEQQVIHRLRHPGRPVHTHHRPRRGPFWTICFGPASHSTTPSEAVLAASSPPQLRPPLLVSSPQSRSRSRCASTLAASYLAGMRGRLEQA